MISTKRWKPKVGKDFYWIGSTEFIFKSIFPESKEYQRVWLKTHMYETREAAEKARRGISKLLKKEERP